METKIELKPCPFCGGEAYIRDRSSTMYTELTIIECKRCGASLKWIQEFVVYDLLTPTGQADGVIKFGCNLSAADAWNRRVVIK